MRNANAAFKQPSNRLSIFSQVPQVNLRRSVFDFSHTHKGSCADGGLLQPFDLYEIIPGDSVRIEPTMFVRMTTQFAPLMDNLYLDLFYFWIPNRLVWPNWPKLMGERTPNPDSSISYTVPIMDFTGGVAIGTTADAFGLPISLSGATQKISSLPFRMYNLIWNEWFRDQNLQNSVVVDTDDGPDAYTDYDDILRRGKRHDYFTSALTSPQKGTAASLPLGTSAPVLGIGKETATFDSAPPGPVRESDATTSTYTAAELTYAGDDANKFWIEQGTAGYPNIRADLSAAVGATINQLREAFAVQRALERDARSGTRYFEIIQSHFGVTDPSSLVPTRPEFLGGSSTPFNQQTVAQTTFQGTETRFDAKGALAANSIFVNNRFVVMKSMTEHGYVMGLFNIRADITYQQGIDKHWLKQTRYHFYLPAFAHLGEQAVQSRELWSDNSGTEAASTGDWSIFGYVPRWDEMRQARNMISGQLRSDATTPLDYLHQSQDFSARPTLSSTFIQDTPPIARTVNITPTAATPAFVFDAFIKARFVRPMPSRGTPGMTDHF